MIRTILTLLFVGGAVAFFMLYTKPAYDGVEALQTENESYDQALEKAAELQRLKQSLLSRYNAFSPTDIDRLHKLLPDHVDNVRLILDLDTLASRHGIALQNVDVSRPTESQGSATVIGPSTRQFESVTLGFSTAATYPQFVIFLTDLEDSLRIVDLENLSISAATVAPGEEPTYRFDMSLRTYWLK